MNGALLWIAGLIVALLAALFAVPYAVDWNSYRGVFEEEASRMLGREVRVGGDVSLRLLPAPYVRFERPRIADEGVGEAFFRAESFTMWLALPQLVQGILEARQIELKRPALRLQIDQDGGGNWNSFRIRQAALPFVPRGVSLQSVKVSNGVVALHGIGGESLARIEIADGELSSPALEGPYKLRANVKWNGETREVRASTAPPDPDGGTRLKLAVRAAQSGNAYTFDGRVADLAGRPQFNGNLVATIPVSSSPGQLRKAAPSETTAAAATTAPAHASAFEVRAAVKADAISARLTDLAFSFEQDGQPQLLTGTAEASWNGPPTVEASLTSHWLDLGRIAGLSADANALEAVRRLAASLTGYLPTQAEVAARIAVDQANIAGDVVSGLVVAIENAGRGLTIKEMRAALPGGSRVEVTGSLTGTGTAEAFKGDVLLRGANLGRFLAWAARGSQLAEAKSDSGFALSARMNLGLGGLEFRNAIVDAGSNRLTGDLTYRWEGHRRFALSIETAHADISAVLPGALGPDLLQAKLGAVAGASPGADLASLLPHLAGVDASVRIRADVLTDGRRELHDLDADITIADGVLKVPSLRVSTPEGFTLELDGRVRNLADRADGEFRGVVAAPSPRALAEVLDIGGTGLDASKRQWLAGLAPLRLAFASRFGQQGKSAAEISIDGTARDAPFVATLSLDGGLGNWRDAPIDAMLTSESAEVARIARGLLLGGARHEEQTGLKQGRLLIKVAGTPAREAAVLIQLSGDDLRLILRGRGALPGDAASRFAGEMDIKAADTGRAVQLAGLTLPARATDGGLEGKIAVSIDDAGLALDFKQLTVSGSRLSGEARLTGPEGARKVDLNLKADRISLPRLIALALDGGNENLAHADVTELLQWRDEPFDFGNLANVNGRVRLKTDALALGEGFGLTDAILEAEVEPGRINITKLEGQALGGAASGAFKLEKTAAGAEMSGAFGLWDIRLDRITGASDAPIGSGRLRLALQLSGQAVTPRALIPVLTGKGELELKAARWDRLSPAAVETAADAVLSGRTAPTGEPLRQALRTALASAPLPLGSRKVPVVVGEGAIKIGAFTIETPQARVTNRTTIDLAEIKIDSEWKLEPKAARGSAAPLPGLSVIYVGPLQSLASLEPHFVLDALERELAVRGMERDVEHLERLRKEDEARARAEAERLKALELEQMQQMQGAGSQPPTIDVPFPLPAAPPSASPAPQHKTIEPGPAPQPRPAAPWPGAPKNWNYQWPVERSGTL